MKKTINVNLGGRAFQITEEAYTKLNDYLNSISTCFKDNEYGEEITTDIESRISELCDERLKKSHSNIIEIELVNEMINRMGKPEAMIDEEEEARHSNNEKKSDKQEDSPHEKHSQNKKYYLDKEDKMVGGVISGLSSYIKFDVTILRIIAVILICAIGPIGLIAYLIVWIVAPVAETTAEKLRMQGIEPTPETIADKLTNEDPEKSEKKGDTIMSKIEKNKRLILAVVIVLSALLFGPKVRITGNNPTFYLLGLSFIITFTLLVTVIALKITDALNCKVRKIFTISLIISSILTILLYVNCYM